MMELDYGADGRRERTASPLLWWGVGVLAVGVGPLVLIIIAAALGLTSDPKPNPIGPGLLAFFTFWPGVGLTIAGAIMTMMRRVRSRNG
jgi:hypothetical protein